VNTPEVLVYVTPLMLNLNPVPGEVTMIVPVPSVQEGCVIVVVGAAGIGLMIRCRILVTIHPLALVVK
jgi:hypothetical protein